MSISRHGDWISAKVGDEIVMMSAEQGKYIGLNDVGARVWELIETPQTIDALVAALLEEFDVTPEVCHDEVTAFIEKLRENNAVEGSA
ncbi:PqqD family peptide modification chaperone [Sphingomonas sp. MMS24-J45]|uniref:PqqD family peptide modification chaperone n=1 Tax=Sphingomonas sp. MMS24-J45 TaxID=3238806 RepID=UPI00385150EC